MKTVKKSVFRILIILSLFFIIGCGKQSTHNKHSNIDKLTVDEIRYEALKYKQSILSKSKIYDEIDCFDDIAPPSEKCLEKLTSYLSEEKGVDINEWMESFADDFEQLEFYRQKLIEKGGDTSGLDILNEIRHQKRKKIDNFLKAMENTKA